MITKSVPARARTRTFAIGIDYVTEHTHQRAVAAAEVAFEGGVSYATAPAKAAWIHTRGVAFLATAALEMEATAALSARCRDPVYHLIIAYAKHERPTREQVVSDAERLLTAVGMEDHQYVLAAHKDTDDFHAHVIANRVGPDGRANDLWHERIIRERVCAEIAAERGWDIVVGRHNRDIVQRIEHLHDLPVEPEWRPSDGAYRRQQERGEPPWQDIARPYVLDAVDRARDWGELHQRLAAHGAVVKLVQRGNRVQGLAFAEGTDRGVRGCAASRIDERCALSALERRFGPFTRPHEGMREPARSLESSRDEKVIGEAPSRGWGDDVRAAILAAVDAAKSWSDLETRLGERGIVVKLVTRGGRVQGLAFAQGTGSDAPGCGASRIDARCKKGALEERFGPFPSHPNDRGVQSPHHLREERGTRESGSPSHEGARAGRERKAERLREERARSCPPKSAARPSSPAHAREATRQGGRSDPTRTVREAGRIVDHAQLRSDYAAYREQFFEGLRRAADGRWSEAWQRERVQRQFEAERRREARQLLRAVARVGSRGLARRIAYWSIEGVAARRRAQDYDASRVRWEAAKIVLDYQRELARKERLMDYRSFVSERARAGDSSAQRVLANLTGASQDVQGVTERAQQTNNRERDSRSQGERRAWSLNELRERLEVLRREEGARYERARLERARLSDVEPPRSLKESLAEERERIRSQVFDTSEYTDLEQAQLTRIARERRSWNPLTRATAARAEERLRGELRSRAEDALVVAMRQFETQLPKRAERFAAEEERYRRYVSTSLMLEEQMNDARSNLRRRLPLVEQRMSVMERAGMTRLDVGDLASGARLPEIAAVIEQQYVNIPEVTRRHIERSIQREQRARQRSRESISMGGP